MMRQRLLLAGLLIVAAITFAAACRMYWRAWDDLATAGTAVFRGVDRLILWVESEF